MTETTDHAAARTHPTDPAPESLMARIVGSGVVAEEVYADPPGVAPHPQEAPLVARAVDKRRREFASARHCARRAMSRIGVDPSPVLRGESGSPVWPAGVVGSLTHCDGYRGAVLAPALTIRSLGIDSEPHEPLPDGVLDATSIEPERQALAALDSPVHRDRVLFCAKEATYKAWFPLTQRWLGFEDAHITFGPEEEASPTPDGGAVRTGTFTSRLLVAGDVVDGGAPLTAFEGRWLVARGLILTAITVR